jgi:DNA-directed RNA polymerase subunit beta'
MYKSQARKYQQLEINLASPKEIRSWAERFLPNGEIVGEVTSWETVNYKTLKPEPNGLFCQKIFGPIVDYTCACGKKAIKSNRSFCPKCGVERTTSQVRRYRIGYISLTQPVAHTLYASQKPSPLGLCLNWPNKKLQAVLYGTEFCHLPNKFEYFSDPNIIEYEWVELMTLNFLKPIFKRKTFGDKNSIFVKGNINRKFKTFRKTPRLFKKTIFPNLTFKKVTTTVTKTEFGNFTKKVPFFRPNQQFLLKSPKLNQWNLFLKIYSREKLSFSSNLYGVGHDTTWRQIEDFQEFLIYMWDQPHNKDGFIPYYFFKKRTEDFALKSVPTHHQYYPVQTGAVVFQKLFAHYNLIGLQRQLALDLTEIRKTINFLKEKFVAIFLTKAEKTKLQIEITRYKELEKKILRRLTYVRDFHKANIQPAWMILSYLPVLPPGLRPITSIRGELVISDLNSLYRKVLTRNRRLTNSTKFSIFDTALSGSWAAWCYNLRQVQESVDALLKTGKVESGKTTKSLLDALKGKRGRFRQHLLGKRVDYSGRSVIVVGPELKIYECGLPKKMAIELFQPFIIQQLRNKGIAFTTTGAKSIISERKPIIWTLLREILQSHPVLLNRAPTLHRLGIQAFLPKLVEGKAILLHPLVCPAFNADFDGDQMAVHVPLSAAARAEAFNILLACNHVLSPASGQPLLLPTQDMILGCYYLTISKNRGQASKLLQKSTMFVTKWYSELNEILEDFNRQKLFLHTPIWVKYRKKVQNLLSEQIGHDRNRPLEIRFDMYGNTEFYYLEKYSFLPQKNDFFGDYTPSSQISESNMTNKAESLISDNISRPEFTLLNSIQEDFIRTTAGRVIFYNLYNKIY